MGMDVYGLKPKIKGKRPEIDWNKPTTEEERNKYFKKLEKLQDLSQKLLKLFKSNETRVVELVASGEDTEATLILFFDKMTWQRDA
jgi:hypothetical protein